MGKKSTVRRATTKSHEQLIKADNQSSISEVVVFFGQAYVKRLATVKVKTGLNRLLLEVKAFQVDPDSVGATVFGKGEILGVQYKELPVADAPQKNIRDLEEKMRNLERSRTQLVDAKAAIAKQEAFLNSVISFAETKVPEEVQTVFPKAASLKGMVDYLGNSYNTLFKQRQKLDQQIEKVDGEIEVLAQKLRESDRPVHDSEKVIEILFKAAKTQDVSIEATYVAQNASWDPVYKVEVPLDLSRVTLNMFAKISQKTGEDWNKVKLCVSNVEPLRGTVLPRPASWQLSLPEAIPTPMPAAAARKRGRTEEASMDILADDDTKAMLALGDLKQKPAEYAEAAQRDLPHAFEYELPQQLTLTSGGDETLVPLFTRELKGEFLGYAVPKRDPRVFLVCRAKAGQELLAGTMNGYFGGRFIGATLLTAKKAGEDLLLTLGVERGIVLKREKLSDTVKETFFRMVDRGTIPRELVYRTVVENLKDTPAHVWVLESVPVSQTDRVQVKNVLVEPEPTEKDYQEQKGVMFWDLTIPSKKTAEIRSSFVVTHPKGRRPEGL